MDDPQKSVKLGTQYDSHLKMWDKHKDNDDIAHIKLATGGKEEILMADKDPDLGNHIQIATADNHLFAMYEGGESKGAMMQTKDWNRVLLDDQNKNITVMTRDENTVLLDDKNETIVVTTTGKHRIEINDQKEYIEVADSSGQHRITIDISGQQITVSTDTGSIDLRAPAGEIKLDAQSIALNASTDVTIDCMDMKASAMKNIETSAGMNSTSKAGMKNEINGMSVVNNGQMEVKLEGLNVISKAQVMNKIEGLMVTSSANGMNNVQGVMVKIN
jgi:hypothetical protein